MHATTLPFLEQRILHLAEIEEEEEENEAEEEDRNDDRQPAPAPTPIVPAQEIPVQTETPAAIEPAPQETPAPVIIDTPAAPATAITAPIKEEIEVPVISASFPWPWIITRATGISSFILLALMTVIGASITTGLLFRFMSPATAWSLHRAIGSTLLISVLIHVISLLFDHFINLHLVDVFVPFASSYQPLYVALGTIGFYLLLLILITSLYTMSKYARFWRIVHYLGFVMFASIFLHGVLVGTDTHQWWMQVIYWGAGIAVGAISIYRVVWKIKTPAK